ncbi:MAG: DNA/RNA non-specific endonuclease [Candidatus Ornithospirochaeta sp.]|nr:DNA/RNA non-specific endonuclease [Candidatus Ornithospirochaeta sp.]
MARKKSKKKSKALRNIIITAVLLAVLFILLCIVSPKESERIESGGRIENLELPAAIPGEQIVTHTGYTLSYNEEYEVPSYVAYELTRNEVLGGGEREDSFKADPAIRTGSATLADYKGSGYDRGHMAPAADFKWSAEAMSDTFYLSNMCPQAGAFNRGIWADLEAAVRTMAYDNGSVYVVTGPVLTDGPYDTIGKNKVAVPKRFYKVVLDYSDPDIKAIGFVLPNEGSDRSLESFAMSVDDVEAITGIDFYPALPDDIESVLESGYDTSRWSFRSFVPTGESAEAEYTPPSSSTESTIIDTMLAVFYELKKAVFEYTGTEGIARQIGLI